MKSRSLLATVRLVLAVLAGILALVGVAALAWILVAAATGAEVTPLSIGLVTWCLPWSFVLLAGVIAISILMRRSPKDSAHTPQ